MNHFNWNFPYATKRMPVFARNVVATSHPLASQAGLRMLQKGGNAVDAALAAAITITICEPISNGLGSDAFAILWDGKELHGLNASGRSPAGWTAEYFAKLGNKPERGWNSVTIPGAVSAWVALSEKFGKLPFGDLFEDAIRYAEGGHMVAPVTSYKWTPQIPVLKEQPGFMETFCPRGRAPQPGELWKLPDAGKSLRLIAQTKGQTFYQGELAEKMASHSQAHGGCHTVADFAAHRADWVGTISQGFAGHELHEIPPSGQGIAALIALGILNHFDIAQMPLDSADSQHLQIEAMKLAFADVHAYVSDPNSMRLTPEQMLDAGYLKERAKLIDMKRATSFSAGKPPTGGTIYLTAADQNGMMVSFIQSNYMGFGSGVVVPGTGISLQNRGAGFVLDPAHANCVAPNKRPFHTIIPAFLTKGGKPQMSFGVMGGGMQPQGHLQTALRMLAWQQNPQAACDAPRWRVNGGLSVSAEAQFGPALINELKARGHSLEAVDDPYMDFGSGQFAWLADEEGVGYLAASDSRRDGLVAGY